MRRNLLIIVPVVFIAVVLFSRNLGFFFPEMFLTPQELRDFGNDIQKVRTGIEEYQLYHNKSYPDLPGLGWKPLLQPSTAQGLFDAPEPGYLTFLHSPPINPLTHSSTIYFIDSTPESDFRAPTEYGFVWATQSHRFWGIDARGALFDDHKYCHP